jgi:hypothetical protein
LERREQHRPHSHVGHHAQQRARRTAEIVDRHDVARAQDLAGQRPGQRESAPASDLERPDRGDELSLVGDGFEHGRAGPGALFGARVAENLK